MDQQLSKNIINIPNYKRNYADPKKIKNKRKIGYEQVDRTIKRK